MNNTDRITGEDILKLIKDEEDLNGEINQFVEKLTTTLDVSRIVIFIDELDRCRPGFAVRLLEQIKHYCHHKNITFVFSINSIQLQHTIKHFYGEHLDGLRYLDKLFDAREPLREISKQERLKAVTHVHNEYYNMYIDGVGRYFNLSLREFDKFVSIMRISVECCYDNKLALNIDETMNTCVKIFVPLLYALHMVNVDKYNRFIGGLGWDTISGIMSYSSDFSLIIEKATPFLAGNAPKQAKDQTIMANLHQLYKSIFANPNNITFDINGLEINADMRQKLIEKASVLDNF